MLLRAEAWHFSPFHVRLVACGSSPGLSCRSTMTRLLHPRGTVVGWRGGRFLAVGIRPLEASVAQSEAEGVDGVVLGGRVVGFRLVRIDRNGADRPYQVGTTSLVDGQCALLEQVLADDGAAVDALLLGVRATGRNH